MKVQDILSKSAKKVDEALKHHGNMVDFMGALPEIDYQDVTFHAAYADFGVTVEIPTRKDLESMILRFPPVDLVSVWDGSFAIMPTTHPDSKRGTVSPVVPVYFRLQEWVANEIHKDFIWYSEITVCGQKKVVRVTARVKEDPAHFEECHMRQTTKRGGTTIVKYDWRAVSLPGMVTMRYGNSHAPKTPPIYLSYWENDCTLEDVLDNL